MSLTGRGSRAEEGPTKPSAPLSDALCRVTIRVDHQKLSGAMTRREAAALCQATLTHPSETVTATLPGPAATTIEFQLVSINKVTIMPWAVKDTFRQLRYQRLSKTKADLPNHRLWYEANGGLWHEQPHPGQYGSKG